MVLVERGLLCGWQSHKSPGASLCGWIRAQITLSLHFFFSHALNIQIFVDNDSEKLGKPLTNLDVDKRNRRNRGIINMLQQLGIQRLD